MALSTFLGWEGVKRGGKWSRRSRWGCIAKWWIGDSEGEAARRKKEGTKTSDETRETEQKKKVNEALEGI